MLQSRDRKLLVLRASSKTDRGVGRNHPLLRLRERASREQHAEEKLWSATPTLGHATAKEDWRYKMTRKVTRWRSSTSDVRVWMSTRFFRMLPSVSVGRMYVIPNSALNFYSE